MESALARLTRDPEIPDGLDPGWRSLLRAMTDRTPGSRPSAAVTIAALETLPVEWAVPAPRATGSPAPVSDRTLTVTMPIDPTKPLELL